MLHYADKRFERSADSLVECSDRLWLQLTSLYGKVVLCTHSLGAFFLQEVQLYEC